MPTLDAWAVMSSRSMSAAVWASVSFCSANGVIPRWMLSTVDVGLSGLEVPDKVWVDGVLHVKVGTLCSFQEGVVDVEMATVHVCLPKHQPEWWEWFSVCETTPA